MSERSQGKGSEPTATQTDTDGQGASLGEVWNTGDDWGDVHETKAKTSDNTVEEDEEEDAVDEAW